MELNSLSSSIKGQVNHNQVQFIVNIFTNLIVEGKSEVYKEKNAIDAIHQKIDKAIVEQEKRAINKQDIENDKWTDKIKNRDYLWNHMGIYIKDTLYRGVVCSIFAFHLKHSK